MFVEQVVILGNVPVVEVGNPKVEQDIEKKREVEDDEIEAIITHPDDPLNGEIDPKNPDRLYEKVKKEE
jgi:hypothetical protein